MVKVKNKASKEKVQEIFKIEKKGEKEKTKKLYSKDESKPIKKGVIKKENKQLKIILIVIGAFVLLFLLVLLVNYKTINFSVGGVDFKVIREGNLIFYDTFFKLYSDSGETTNYHFYTRIHPKTLIKDVPFIGDLILKENMVIEMESDFNCDGDGIIAVANLVNVLNVAGVEVIRDETAECELSGQYTFVQIEEGDETFVKKFGPSCYLISIKECEILEGTERFMLETFIKVNKAVKN